MVDNGDTGATAAATDWTLTAENGDSPITGATGTDPVTGAAAIVGTYDLSETGPAGYTASDWVCTGGTATTADSVTLGPRRQRHLHHHQHRHPPDPDPGQDRRQRQPAAPPRRPTGP